MGITFGIWQRYVLVIEAALDITRSEKLKRAAEMCSIALLAIGIIIPIVCRAFDLPYRIEIVRNFLFEGYPNQKYFNENREKFKLMEFKLGGTGIYLIHVFVLSIINCLLSIEDGLFKTIMCFCISGLFVIAWEQIVNIIKKLKKHRG